MSELPVRKRLFEANFQTNLIAGLLTVTPLIIVWLVFDFFLETLAQWGHPLAVQFTDFLEDPPATLQQHLAFRGQRDASRAAMEQAHAQVRLEPRNRLANGRRGQPEFPCHLRPWRAPHPGKEGSIVLPSALPRQSQAIAASACAG